eukprot:CAMPEP_0170479160 /NCGR_PEP_ID=MMETSP0208-20121228/487_1 /TAXON_ID=197538 /ORGANISM="Strombidium inclinatum, Strain S3" /LENGTH=130 /DNA_ID=CAMNT_0010751509 /DNA_START=179 /DNA_END=568 /DNA_ORIENTATION=+
MAPKYAGLLGTAKTVIGEEGFRALYKGLTAGIHRQVIFSGIRVGLYTPVRDSIAGPLEPGQHASLLTKMLAAIVTGAIGITIANPTDVVKVRLQNQSKANLAGKSSKMMYKGTIDCYSKIIKNEGLKGLW